MTEKQRKGYRETGWFAFIVAFLLTLSLPFPTVAVVAALVFAVLLAGGAAALNVRDAKRTGERIVAEEVSR